MGNAVYLVLTQSGTKVSQAIRLFTRKPFNHASIASDKELNTMFSFCRKYNRPLPAGFNQEYVGEGVFGRFDIIPCEIYRLDLTESQRRIYDNTIRYFISHQKGFDYNLLGLGAILIRKNLPRKSKYLCSQFVAYVISEIGFTLNKPVFLNTPDDLRHLPEAKLIYSGELNHYFNSYSSSSQEPPL